MANQQITWGKPLLEVCAYVNGALPATPIWKALPTQKENTVKLNIEKGDKKEAKGEGGELVAVRFNKNKYTLECEVFIAEGTTPPIAENDGIVATEYAVRLTPENDALTGFIIDKSNVSVEGGWSSEEGMLLKYTFEALQPTTGKILKPYKKA